VREFTAEDERRITIALDTRRSGQEEADGFTERFERGVTLAASLVAHFVEERAEVRLVLGTEEGRYGVGREHLYDCLRRLALVVPQDESAPKSNPSVAAARDIADPSAPAAADGNYCILLTTAAPGSIPSNVWRTSYVKYL
jgi:uncharacterized protein (DUF58 family)